MQFERLHAITPDVVAVDAHPGYTTSRWARLHHPDRIVEVQHHHAHIASVMAEHECDPHEPVIGFAFDGTGYGDDGDRSGVARCCSPTPTGTNASPTSRRSTFPVATPRSATPAGSRSTHLRHAGVEWTDDLAPVRALQPHELELLERQLERRVACVPTTSIGRLFDAVASLLGLRHRISYEAQAAIQLEMAAAGSADREAYQLRARWPDHRPGPGRPRHRRRPARRGAGRRHRPPLPRRGPRCRRRRGRSERASAGRRGGALGRRVPERAARHDVRRRPS